MSVFRDSPPQIVFVFWFLAMKNGPRLQKRARGSPAQDIAGFDRVPPRELTETEGEIEAHEWVFLPRSVEGLGAGGQWLVFLGSWSFFWG